MAWLAVHKNGGESIFAYMPQRGFESWNPHCIINEIVLPKGSIRKLIGRDLTWEDNPVELKEEYL